MSKITIIIPIYNVNEDYFKKCMKSVLNQTLKDIEVILVDDGSKKNIGTTIIYIWKGNHTRKNTNYF